jgi:HEAT repeat protein
MISEAGWTVLPLPAGPPPEPSAAPAPVRAASVRYSDPAVQTVAELRSHDASRVTAALSTRSLGRLHVAQVIDLLARDDVLPATRAALDRLAPEHLGMLIDALLDPSTDFVIRRRLPRILGLVAVQRSLDGLVNGLDDARFEVRYHCSRAIRRILTRNPDLSVQPARMIAVIEGELAIPPQRWRGYWLLDQPEQDDRSEAAGAEEDSSRYLEHVWRLLSTIVPREAFDAAVHAVRSPNPGVRGLALEYFEQVVPPAVLERLKALIASTPSGAGVPSQSDVPPTATGS